MWAARVQMEWHGRCSSFWPERDPPGLSLRGAAEEGMVPMMRHDAAATYDIQGNTLRVRGELELDERSVLQEQLAKLIETDDAPLVLDLSGISFMGSSYMGIVSSAILAARKRGHAFTIRAASRMLRLLKLAGIDKLGTFELAPEDHAPCHASGQDHERQGQPVAL
jgi:anti-anti-sigma factor